jgi:hypothetical protein
LISLIAAFFSIIGGDAGVADAGAAIDETEGVLQRDKQRSSGKEAALL